MKQLDRLILKSFVGPFLVSFAVALFVLLMQYLWVYIDDIIGKGAGILLIAELIGYLSISLMPMALSIAVLIASVMTMGNLAEHYELSSMKSAGVPLMRIMAPLMIACLGISAFSFTCSNYLMPVANLKARTRMYDIRTQKPSLSLEEGAFNDDFQGFAIRIGKKMADEKSLEDVMLFRHGGTLRGRIESVNAERGTMSVTPDDRYFVLELEEGYQYQEPESSMQKARRTHPFVRTKFETYRKTFDLSEFEIDRTDESSFSSHQGMLSVGQLDGAIDSIRNAMMDRRNRLGIEVGRFITPIKQLDRAKLDSIEQLRRDSIKLAADMALAADDDAERRQDTAVLEQVEPEVPLRRRLNIADRLTHELPPRDTTTDSYVTYIRTRPAYKQVTYLDRSIQFARTIKSYADGATRRLDSQRDSLIDHIYELHLKFSFALACFVFLFIGAPMGAIIRKGGFGYPILVSIIFFMIFIVLLIMCKKLMGSYTLAPGLAAWMPTLVVFPIGVVITLLAMNDRKVSLPDRASFQALFRRIGGLFRG